MSYFFESSAILKRYHSEPGSEWVWAVCKSRKRPIFYLSAIAEVEVPVALRRTASLNRMQHSWADAKVNQFFRDMVSDYQIIDLDRPILRVASALANKHTGVPTLRSLDAVQLACALSARLRDPQLTFVVADARLGLIARREGLDVIDPAHP